jgi:two-component system phosphate regulon response regulator PhoB
MPHMSGVERAELLKLREKRAKIPIVLMSKKEVAEFQVLAKDVGVEDFLLRPFSPEALVRKFDALISH